MGYLIPFMSVVSKYIRRLIFYIYRQDPSRVNVITDFSSLAVIIVLDQQVQGFPALVLLSAEIGLVFTSGKGLLRDVPEKKNPSRERKGY